MTPLICRFDLGVFQESFIPGRTRGLVDTCLNIQTEAEHNKDGHSWLSDDMIKAVILDVIGAGMTLQLHEYTFIFANSANCIILTIE